MQPEMIALSMSTTVAQKISTKLLEKIGSEIVEMTQEFHHAFANSFTAYIKTAYERHSYFTSLVFPNQQKRLKDFYLPLTLIIPNPNGNKEHFVDEYPGSLIVEKKDLLVVDTAGMGKSTILKFMFLEAIELNTGIPIFLELRKLGSKKSILDFIYEQLANLDGAINKQLVLRLIQSGDFIFFFDGYDEIADEDRANVTAELKDFKQKSNKNHFVMSSRDQVGLGAFSDFFRVTIRPLKFHEAEQLIAKYSQGHAIGATLIEKINRPENQPIREFLENPLLVSLLFKAFEYKPTIPLKKHVFYRQVFEALFENHDLSKDAGELVRSKLCGLDIHSFEIAMRALGYLSFQKTKVEFAKDELLLLIEKIKSLVPSLQFNPQALLQDLVSRVPLFILEGNTYRWNHKSLLEYFAALYLSAAGRERQQKVLDLLYKRGKESSHLNFLLLFADVDEKGFRQSLLPILINDLTQEFSKFFTGNSSIPPELLAERKSLVAFRNQVLINLAEDEFQKLNAKGRAGTLFEITKPLVEKQLGLTGRYSGEHQGGHRTVVNYYDEKFGLLVKLIQNLNLGFVYMSGPKSPPLTNQQMVFLQKLEKLHVLTDAPSDAANSEENFSLVNLFLASHVPAIHFDMHAAQLLLAKIESEILEEERLELSF